MRKCNCLRDSAIRHEVAGTNSMNYFNMLVPSSLIMALTIGKYFWGEERVRRVRLTTGSVNCLVYV
jgi:hypothetical protein